ncbi:hypothetical protein Lbir_0566 [Legionella birminghamensis]|uniref:Phage envelope protein n=1 Tax=Legionella birminghamensis TaxID=28083 RepID=A0A378I9H5_9GAMM|nr:DUF1398 family protein [Legionella birminghamensis]KTC75192.1 hypothetical protein Lbir_0566 [Legionella birminghamensis]STX31857.1 Phage envelope protein [Legionella birminghamensis]
MHFVLKLVQQAQEEQWPFPYTLSKLRDAGVVQYHVSWDQEFKIVFQLIDNTQVEENHPEFQIDISGNYSLQGARIALLKHQQGMSSYAEWLNEMGQSGVIAYRVDPYARTVTYFGSEPENFFVEQVPGE